MKSASKLWLSSLLLLVATLFGACTSKEPSSLHVREIFYAPKESLARATYLAYIPTEISTRYTLRSSSYETLSPWMELHAKEVAQRWNRLFPAILEGKDISIIKHYPSFSSLSLEERAKLPGVFSSKILAKVEEVSLPQENKEIKRSRVILSLEAEMFILEPASQEILWSQKSDLGELLFDAQGEVSMNVIGRYLEGVYGDLEGEMIARLEAASRSSMIVPTEEVRLMKRLPKR